MITIIGAGIVGLVLANALAGEQFAITLVDNKLPELTWPDNHLDPKVSAINMASWQILKNLKVWESINPSAIAPLRELQVWDKLGGGQIHFDCADIGAPQLGFIIENRALIKALWEKLAAFENVSILCPRHPSKLTHIVSEQSPRPIEIQLDNGATILADLVVGADGGRSWVRDMMGVAIAERSYEQQALIFVAHSALEHRDTGWQSFLSTGPLGVLPLNDRFATAIVWSNTLPAAKRLLEMSSTDFNQELTTALDHRLGSMVCVSPLQAIPLVMRHAMVYVQPRLALIGDAAHTIHPLAGQGVNLGLLDAAVLAQVIADARNKQQDIGSLRVLTRYQRWRKAGNSIMLAAMRGFKDLFSREENWLIRCRSLGLDFTDHSHFLKKLFMDYAMGRQGDLPPLANHLAPDIDH
ncbi:MAG: UbiH/UbiF/VisC/COQ6 family ubiquinone biosynthesis hydroxylase [Proteobacteria bacterium]|nr:UbiH/UbiF/VisC/COQ6 family ubiquinone biosynthesis hydroxylase [Pseudomonadota bacterium]